MNNNDAGLNKLLAQAYQRTADFLDVKLRSVEENRQKTTNLKRVMIQLEDELKDLRTQENTLGMSMLEWLPDPMPLVADEKPPAPPKAIANNVSAIVAPPPHPGHKIAASS